MNKNKTYIAWIIGIIAVVALGIFLVNSANTPSPYTGFASCLAEKKAVFYGAFWCPHCQNQKKMFGNAASKLPYVECSTADGQGQTKECIDKGIKNYPTWEFPDLSRLTGEVPLKTLAEKTGCVLPQ